MKVLFYFVIAVLVFTLGADAQGRGRGRGRGRGGRGRRPTPVPQPDEVSSWEREVDGATFRQSGRVFNSSRTVSVGTRGQKNSSVSASVTLYDFSNASNPVVAMKLLGRKSRVCFLIPLPSGVDFDSVSQEVSNRNGSTVTDTPVMLELNGTDTTPTDVPDASDILKRFCSRFGQGQYVSTETPNSPLPSPGSEDEGQKVRTALTLDSKVTILINTRPNTPGTPGKPGRRGRPGSV